MPHVRNNLEVPSIYRWPLHDRAYSGDICTSIYVCKERAPAQLVQGMTNLPVLTYFAVLLPADFCPSLKTRPESQIPYDDRLRFSSKTIDYDLQSRFAWLGVPTTTCAPEAGHHRCCCRLHSRARWPGLRHQWQWTWSNSHRSPRRQPAAW